MRIKDLESYLDWFEQRKEEVNDSNHDLFCKGNKQKLREVTTDGPISSEYFSQEKKILWVLREPNGEGGGSLIDYVQGLYDRSINNGNDYLKGGLTYICLAAATYGIIHGKTKYGDWADNRKEMFSILPQIGIINLNKFGGGKTLSKHYYLGVDKCIGLVGDQFQQLKPKVIICGGTFGDLGYIKIAPTELDLSWPVRGSNGKFDAERSEAGKLYISAYHSGVRAVTISREEYVNRILKAFRKYH